MHARWKPTERAARVANGFERERRPHVDTSDPFGPMVGVSIFQDPPPPVSMMAVQESYWLSEGRRRGRA